MVSTLFWITVLVASLTIVWQSASRVIQAVERLARNWHISPFTFSVLVLGTATSLPEISVVLTSTTLHAPQLAMGNLIGGQVLLLLVVLPLFAVSAGGLSFKNHLNGKSLPLTLLTIAAPSLALIDGVINWGEALLLAVVYAVFFIFSFRAASPLEKVAQKIDETQSSHKGHKVLQLIVGMAFLLVGSFGAVRSLLYLEQVWNWPAFVTGFIVLSLGTNLPELALLLQSLLKRKRSVALGDYVGSATFNTILAVVITFMNGGQITFSIPLFVNSILFISALGLFWFFGVTDTKLSVTEATVLLGIYGLITIFQAFFSHPVI